MRKITDQRKKRMFTYYSVLFLTALLILGAGTLAVGRLQSRPIQRILRPETGQGDREEKLLADDGEQKVPLMVNVAARERSEEELEALFDAAEKELSRELKGANESLSRVTTPLCMPGSVQDGQVMVSWSCDRPEYVSYDGTLGEEIPVNGVTVQLEAALECQQQVRWYRQTVTVFGAAEEEGLAGALLAAKQDKTDKYYELPRSFAGKELVWYRRVDNPAPMLAAVVVLLGLLVPLRGIEAKKQESKQYRDRLLLAYPTLVSQITLYLGAGMSLSQAFTCMAASGRKGAEDVLERECALLVREMGQGVPEGEAIQRFGDRSGLWEYRTFCGMLLQSRKKGNAELLPMLQNEAEKAFAERQRRARITGNEAGTRLLMPMTLMLVIVLVIVMFPAVVSFYT